MGCLSLVSIRSCSLSFCLGKLTISCDSLNSRPGRVRERVNMSTGWDKWEGRKGGQDRGDSTLPEGLSPAGGRLRCASDGKRHPDAYSL